MFTINTANGVVTRDSDGSVIAPFQDYNSPEHLAYLQWVEAGNLPTEVCAPERTLEELKEARQEAVESIVVTAQSGRQFDGDEKSQDRMGRALAALDDGEFTPWVLATGGVEMVSKSELKEALRMAGAEMKRIWVSIY